MPVKPKTRDAVFERDHYRCVSCGTENGLSIQHRVNRGMGGSKLRDRMSSLVTMCWTHNTALEADATFAALGRERGWKVSSWDDPAQQPVYYVPEGTWFYLRDDGVRVPDDS